MSGPAFFSFWIDRFVGATSTWTEEEVGAYLRLLLHQLREGEIPGDPTERAELVRMPRERFEAIWAKRLAPKFKPTKGGGLANPKMTEERKRALAASRAQSTRAKRGWSARKHDAPAMPGHSPGVHRAKPESTPGNATSDLRPPTEIETETQTHPGALRPTRGGARAGGQRRFEPTAWAFEQFPSLAPRLTPTIAAWLSYRREKRLGAWSRMTWERQLRRAALDPDAWIREFEHAISSGWHAPVEGKGGGLPFRDANGHAADRNAPFERFEARMRAQTAEADPLPPRAIEVEP